MEENSEGDADMAATIIKIESDKETHQPLTMTETVDAGVIRSGELMDVAG